MSNVVRISDFRKDRRQSGDDPPTWLFDLRAFGKGGRYEGSIIDFNETVGGSEAVRLRMYADCLDQLSWFIRQQAEQIEPSEDGFPLAAATVFESSRVRVRVNDEKVVTKEQMGWLDRCFDDAKEAARMCGLHEQA